MKEIEEDPKKWENIPCSWVGRTNTVKMSILPKAIYTFNAILIKIPPAFFTKLEQTILKFVWNHKRPQVTKAIWKKKNKTGDITISEFRLYYKAVVIKQYGTGTEIDTYINRTESSEINSQIYGLSIFDKVDKNVQWEKISSTNGVGKNGQLHAKE